ncbi:MAG: sulfotransferase domain-containing protein [Rhodospirillales bacterium]|nr:sulfotransferase domain-containing protein [Rhodospirillales bacterium]
MGIPVFAWDREEDPLGRAMGRIVWIASYPKSGNTWTRAFLHNLFRDPASSWDINRMLLLSSNEAAIAHYTALDPRPWTEWSHDDVAAMRPRVHRNIAASKPHTVFCKTHVHVGHVRGFPTINVEVTAGAVYLLRNPLDVVESYALHQGLTLDRTVEMMTMENFETPNSESHVNEPMGSWSQHVESWTGRPSPGLHIMRYEDMLARPLKAFGDLVTFLQLKTPRDRIARAVKNSGFRVLQHQEQKYGFYEKTPAQDRFFRSGKAGGWKDVLSDDQVAAICDANREQMARFGYLPERYA